MNSIKELVLSNPESNAHILEIQCSTVNTQSSGKSTLGFNTTEITAISSLATVIVSMCVAFFTIRKYGKDLKQQQDKQDIEKHHLISSNAKEKLEKFYGPCNALLEESRLLYAHFALSEKQHCREIGDYFRTLRYISDDIGASKLSNHDQSILLTIIDTSKKIISLIEEYSGFVDNPELHSLLGKLCTHYKILVLAYDGKLVGQADNLEEIVFPLEINGAIDSEIRRLKQIIKNQPNNIKKKGKKTKTIDYYNLNSFEYYCKTYSNDMGEIYTKVRKYIQNGSRILDAGCGVGRDTEYFIRHGFKVTSFDASREMVNFCNQYSFAYCEELDFSDVDYPPVFSLVWASASLLHLDKSAFDNAIKRLYKATSPGGYIYFSLKKSSKKTDQYGRRFYLYQDEYLFSLLEEKLNMVLVERWESQGGTNKTPDIFLNYIFYKK